MTKLKYYNNPVLRAKCTPIETITSEVEDIGLDLLEELKLHPTGVGLSAPQIGHTVRMILVKETLMINPEIVSWSKDSIIGMEGCLSLPEIEVSIPRHSEIKIKYLDMEGQEHQDTLKDLDARIAHHEIDHLDGKLIIDNLSEMNKLRIAKKLKEIDKLQRGL